MDFDLERFVKAQDDNDNYQTAIQELENGEKESHWIWFIFPQMRGLGHSEMSKRFGISSLYEAYAYLNHEELRGRLYDAVRTLNEHNYGRDIEYVMGDVDAIKLKSCLTLFDVVEPEGEFDRALRYFFDEERDDKTLQLIANDRKVLDEEVWKKFGVKYPERAFFDDGCHEANGMEADERCATFLDFVRRGYSIVTLTWQYLIRHGDLFDDYRTSNTETTLQSIGFNFLLNVYEWLEKQIDPTPITQLEALFPLDFFEYSEGMTWEKAAYRLDALFKFMINNPILSGVVDSQITAFSLIPQE